MNSATHGSAPLGTLPVPSTAICSRPIRSSMLLNMAGIVQPAMVDGFASNANPEAWRIVEGKLYLNASKEGLSKWESNAAEEIERADSQWGVLKAHLTD